MAKSKKAKPKSPKHRLFMFVTLGLVLTGAVLAIFYQANLLTFIPGGTRPPIKSPEYPKQLQQYLDQPASQYNNQTPRVYWSKTQSLTGGKNARKYYELDSAVSGLLSVYEATKDPQYLDLALLWVTNMMSTAQPYNWDGYQSKTPHPYTAQGFLEWSNDGGINPPTFLNDLKATWNWPRLVKLIKQDGSLASKRPSALGFKSQYATLTYDQLGTKILDFVDLQVMQKWLVYRGLGDYNTGWAWMTGVQDAPLSATTGYWQGQQTMTMQIASDLYVAGKTGKVGPTLTSKTQDYRALAVDMAKQFKEERSTAPGDFYIWNRNETGNAEINATPRVPETWHSNRTAQAMITLYDNKLIDPATGQQIITRQDLLDMTKTFMTGIWNGVFTIDTPTASVTQNGKTSFATLWFRNYLDGQDAAYGYPAGNAQCTNPRFDVAPYFYKDCFNRFNYLGHPQHAMAEGMSGQVSEGFCMLGSIKTVFNQRTALDVCDRLNVFQITGSSRANIIWDRNSDPTLRVSLLGNLARSQAITY